MNQDESKSINILLIDDDEDEYIIARDLFAEIGNQYKVTWINNFDKGLIAIKKDDYEICLLDYHLGARNGVDFIIEASTRTNDIPIILLTGQGDHEVDLKAMKAGAADYLNKNRLDADMLERSIRYAIERKKTAQKIRFLAYYDQLTHLPNRTLFFERLSIVINAAKRHNRICAVMFLDMDNFKRINDTLGHNIGDELIKETASRLSNCIRDIDMVTRDRPGADLDTVARLGGDEFTILLSEIKEAQDASIVAARIQGVLAAPFLIEKNKINVTVSTGISIFPFDGDDIESLIKNADLAMYNAKNNGKNNFQYYNGSMNQAALQRLNVENELRRGLENNEMVLYYQPVINLKSGLREGLQALLYWKDPVKGLIPQDQFIPVAEESGLMVTIGNWILNQAFHELSLWRKKILAGINISISISPRHLCWKNFIDNVSRIIDEYNVPADCFTFELSESCIINNTQTSLKIITAVKKLGIKISLADFGSGFTSFVLLKEFPFDILKIDSSFIQNIGENVRDSTIASSLIEIGHSMNLKVLAGGVTTEQQVEFLKDKGCDFVQGSYYNDPVPGSLIV